MDHSLHTKAERLRALHHGPDMLILPNVWDIPTALMVARAGFPAIASSSAAIAHALGYPDGEEISRDEMLGMVRAIARRVDVPVTADLEAGYGPDPKDVADTVRAALDAGIVGANLEDFSPRYAGGFFTEEDAATRIAAARAAADEAGVAFVINARTDAYLHGAGIVDDPFAFTIRRARLLLDAGADCIFVPGIADGETVSRIVAAIDGPVNILVRPTLPPLAELSALGVARVSLGSNISLAAYGFFSRAVNELAATGTYGFTEGAATYPELQELLAEAPED